MNLLIITSLIAVGIIAIIAIVVLAKKK